MLRTTTTSSPFASLGDLSEVSGAHRRLCPDVAQLTRGRRGAAVSCGDAHRNDEDLARGAHRFLRGGRERAGGHDQDGARGGALTPEPNPTLDSAGPYRLSKSLVTRPGTFD